MALADTLTESGQFEEAAAVIREAKELNAGSQIERTYFWGRLMFRMKNDPIRRHIQLSGRGIPAQYYSTCRSANSGNRLPYILG